MTLLTHKTIYKHRLYLLAFTVIFVAFDLVVGEIKTYTFLLALFFVTYLLYLYGFKNKYKLLRLIFIVLFVTFPILFIFGYNIIAEKLSVWAFSFLCLALIHRIKYDKKL